MSESKTVLLKTDIVKADHMHWYEGNGEEIVSLDRKQVCSYIWTFYINRS